WQSRRGLQPATSGWVFGWTFGRSWRQRGILHFFTRWKAYQLEVSIGWNQILDKERAQVGVGPVEQKANVLPQRRRGHRENHCKALRRRQRNPLVLRAPIGWREGDFPEVRGGRIEFDGDLIAFRHFSRGTHHFAGNTFLGVTVFQH